MLKSITLLISWLCISHTHSLCCYYRQHYHNVYCDDDTSLLISETISSNFNIPNSCGCILTDALVSGPPMVVCGYNGGCSPPEGGQGYWLEGFQSGCDDCESLILP